MQLLAGDNLAGTLQQDRQNPKRLFLQRDPSTFFTDLATSEVNFEEPGANTAAGTGERVHHPPSQEPDFTPIPQFMELNNSFGNFLLASQKGFRAGQLTGLGPRAKKYRRRGTDPPQGAG